MGKKCFPFKLTPFALPGSYPDPHRKIWIVLFFHSLILTKHFSKILNQRWKFKLKKYMT